MSDYWIFEKDDAAPVNQPVLQIAYHKIPSLSDQSGIPFWDRDWIELELYEILFGQPNKDQFIRTYFIVDATLRTDITKVFDLDNLDVPVRCLFKGEAAEELEEVAPYLIDMTLSDEAFDDKDKVPAFHKDFFAKHWKHNTGIFIRTTATMAEVWGHFRKFPRVQVEEDKRWVFFRFWNPRIALSYFLSIKNIPEKVAQWVCVRGTGRIEAIIGHHHIESEQSWSMTPSWNDLEAVKPAGTPMLSDVEIAGLNEQVLSERDDEILTFILSATSGKNLYEKNLLREFITGLRKNYVSMGFKSFGDVKNLIFTDFLLGADTFKSQLLQILSMTSQIPSSIAMYYNLMENRRAAFTYMFNVVSTISSDISTGGFTDEKQNHALLRLSQKSKLHQNHINALCNIDDVNRVAPSHKSLLILAKLCLGENFHLDKRFHKVANAIFSEKDSHECLHEFTKCVELQKQILHDIQGADLL